MRFVLFLIGLLLAGCSTQQWNEKLSTPADRALALQVIAALRAGNLDPVKTVMEPRLYAQTVEMMPKIGPVLAVPGTPSLVTVSTNTMVAGGATETFETLNYEFGSGSRWMVMQIQLRHATGRTEVTGWHAEPMTVQPTTAGNFSFAGKGFANHLWIAVMLASTGTILTALVLAIRSRGIKRRWLWIIGILCGLGRFLLNWSTGEWTVQPIGFALFGAGIMRASPFAPWVLTFSLPIVAIVFLVLRRNLLPPSVDDEFA